MPRRRLGVALLLPEPAATEVHGLRRACADPALDTVPPHLTLVPPVNVAEDDLVGALALLRREAAATPALHLHLGPPETFLPVEPVLFLGVGGPPSEVEQVAAEAGRPRAAERRGAPAGDEGDEGDEPGDEDVAALHDLRQRVFTPPLARPLAHPFVPHVTLCASGTPQWIDRSAQTLVAYEADVVIERLHLLQEVQHDDGRRWEPIADLAFAPEAVVARGGLELRLSTTELVDPEVGALLPEALRRPAEGGAGPAGRRSLVVSARRDGEVLGTAVGWTSGTVAVVRRIAEGPGIAPGEEVSRHLRAAFDSAAADRGALEVHEEPAVG